MSFLSIVLLQFFEATLMGLRFRLAELVDLNDKTYLCLCSAVAKQCQRHHAVVVTLCHGAMAAGGRTGFLRVMTAQATTTQVRL